MNEQYAFAIAFDQHAADSDAQVTSTDWSSLLTQVEKAIEFEGFPNFDSARWDKFGEGYIFWGSKKECGVLKECLCTFPVSIYEERNLDTGYYSCTFGVYYVDESGNILGLDSRVGSLNGFDIRTQETIPLEAYKTDQIEPGIHERFQQALVQGQPQTVTRESPSSEKVWENVSSTDPQVNLNSVIPVDAISESLSQSDQSSPHVSQGSEFKDQIDQLTQQLDEATNVKAANIPTEIVASLNQLVNEQTQQLKAQEQVIEQHQSQMHDLQLMLDRKVDPEVHAHLQQHAIAQTEQISELEQELQQLKQTHAQILASESQRISASEYERLGHVSAEQGKTIIELESQLQTMQRKLDATQLEMTQKVDEASLQQALAEKSQQMLLAQKLQTQIQTLEKQLQQAQNRVKRTEFEGIVQEASQLKSQIQTLEQDKQQLLKEVSQWTQIANAKVDRDQFETIQQKATSQTSIITEQQKNIDQLQNLVADWQSVAAQKVERTEYEAALSEINRIRKSNARTFIERLKDWLFGK